MNGLLDLWIDGGSRPQIRFAMAAPLAISRDIAVSGWILWPFNLILDGARSRISPYGRCIAGLLPIVAVIVSRLRSCRLCLNQTETNNQSMQEKKIFNPGFHRLILRAADSISE
jgi:hypothetical protein